MSIQNHWFLCIVLMVASYFIGSISFAIIVTKFVTKSDIREHGSGNAGTTNVLRTVGKKGAIFTLMGDFLKGYFPILFVKYVTRDFLPEQMLLVCYLAGTCIMLGHIFPVFYKFKGGKGFATAAAVMLAIDARIFAFLLIIFIIMIVTTRMVSLSVLRVAVAFPIATILFQWGNDTVEWVSIFGSILFCFIIILAHRANIIRLLNGTEYQFKRGQKEESQ